LLQIIKFKKTVTRLTAAEFALKHRIFSNNSQVGKHWT